ncbi:C4-dicarboxylate ABC transporter [Marinococcus halophilus]|uniref:C4-dicarboxylate ABC transporter substrate-binding protein n=1 Tax=Marinococcus halophilus TaxID=1371 RepID=A0A510Y6S9_MARHA|nr:TRAP transporter substrate-binding protein [Marinococcus halophilus]OZT79708.1 C4-dicarboxylate ABC transporter [Marinococcus halophilus]GEK59064.1 C4-dicarboxylate ABC transporter substrate-binding protein [Marinococcus halophilus]
MKIWKSFLVGTASVLALSGCSTQPSAEEQEVTTWKLNHFSDSNHYWNETSEYFADRVEEYTDGSVNIEVYANGQLGDEVNTINSIQHGAIDMTITGETLENWTPSAMLMATPYAFNSQEHMRSTVEGEIGQEIESDIKENAGLTPLFYMERSPRNLTSNRPISAPEDLNGLDMRVPNVPLFIDAWSEAGAQPQSISLSEVFTALQQGVIDGQENPNDLIQSNGFYEVQNYINETQHVRSWIYVVIGNDQFEALTPEEQDEVQRAAEDAQEYSQELFTEQVETVEQTLRDEGVQFNENVDQKAFQQAMQPAIREYFDQEQYEMYQQIVEQGKERENSE